MMRQAEVISLGNLVARGLRAKKSLAWFQALYDGRDEARFEHDKYVSDTAANK